MGKSKIQEMLDQWKDDETPSYFSLKKSGQQDDPDVHIDANRNGILAFCNLLLQSLERPDRKDEFVSQILESFYADDSDAWITHINVSNGERTPVVEKDSVLTQVGCFAALAAIAIVFLVGLVKSVGWIGELISNL